MLGLLRVLSLLLSVSLAMNSIRANPVGDLKEQLAEENDVDEVILTAVPIERLVDTQIDYRGLQEKSLKRFNFDLAKKRVLFM